MRSALFKSPLALLLVGLVTYSKSLAAPGNNQSTSEASPTVSVKDLGAKGDGITDDRSAVQAAIDSLTKGGTVSFPAGTYLMDSYVTAKAGDNSNLVTSHDDLTFAPAPGSPAGSVKLIHGPHGWGTLRHRVFGPLAVFNSGFFPRLAHRAEWVSKHPAKWKILYPPGSGLGAERDGDVCDESAGGQICGG